MVVFTSEPPPRRADSRKSTVRSEEIDIVFPSEKTAAPASVAFDSEVDALPRHNFTVVSTSVESDESHTTINISQTVKPRQRFEEKMTKHGITSSTVPGEATQAVQYESKRAKVGAFFRTVVEDVEGESDWGDEPFDIQVDHDVSAAWKTDPLRGIRSVRDTSDKRAFDETYRRMTRTLPPEKAVDFFTPGSTWYRYRQRCIWLKEQSAFQTFFLTVILVNAIFLAFEAGLQTFSPGWAFESACTTLYWIELVVSTLGCPTYPWRVIPLWLDWILVLGSTLDLWVFALLDYMGVFPRPQMSVISVLRLFRFSRVFKAADSFLIYARPLRMVKWTLKETPGFALMLFMLLAFCLYMATVTLRSSSRIQDEAGVHEFSSYPNTFIQVACIVCGAHRWKFVLASLEGAELSKFLLYFFTYTVKIAMTGMIIAVIVEQLLHAGQADDHISNLKGAYRKMKVPKLRELLKKLDVDGSGDLDFEELKRAFAHHPHLTRVFGMSAEETLEICRHIDTKEIGAVEIDELLLGILSNKVREKSFVSMVDQYRMNQLVKQAEATNSSTRKLSFVSCREESGDQDTGSPLDSYISPEERRRLMSTKSNKPLRTENFKSGLVHMVEETIEHSTVSSALLGEMDRSVTHLEEKLKKFDEVVNGEHFTSEHHTEGGIRIASMQFRLQVEKCQQMIEMWMEVQE